MTAGEPAGIGPDLCALLAGERFPGRLVFIGNRAVIEDRARRRGLRMDLPEYSGREDAPPASLISLPTATDVSAGVLDRANAGHVTSMLDRAIAGCRAGEFDAMVTAPVQKSVINEAGIAFTGHTEYLAAACGVERVVMLLAGGGLRVALATTHLPLAEVPRAITRQGLEQVIRIVERDLRLRFGFPRPRILVAGLNPHAGESGYLGREEIEVISPVIHALAAEGLDVSGPFPADTLYTPRVLANADVTVAMFHDQGLPVLKHAAFGNAVNVTLGLPIVRTSVDHGTALDLAGAGEVDAGSLRAAIELAFQLALRG